MRGDFKMTRYRSRLITPNTSRSWSRTDIHWGVWVTGSTYRLRISNVGTKTTLNFRVQGHKMVLVETEGSYTQQESLDSLDVHVGQSYSVLLTADQTSGDYFIMASPRFENATTVLDSSGVALMHYSDSTGPATGSHPVGPDPDDIWFSLKQAQSIKYILCLESQIPLPSVMFFHIILLK